MFYAREGTNPSTVHLGLVVGAAAGSGPPGALEVGGEVTGEEESASSLQQIHSISISLNSLKVGLSTLPTLFTFILKRT